MAGATLVAAGNGAPDLVMTALAGTRRVMHQLSATISNYQH